MAEALKERKDMDPAYQWDLSSLYTDDAAWETALQGLDECITKTAAFEGTLTTAEAIRAVSMRITRRAMLSRAVSVIRGKTLIINLPGSPKACMESMDVFLDTLPHGMGLLRGTVHDCARA